MVNMDTQTPDVSPISTVPSALPRRNTRDEKYSIIDSPAETVATSTFYPDDKIAIVSTPVTELSTGPEAALRAGYIGPPKYEDEELPARSSPLPFWRRNIIWILGAIIAALIILVSVLAVKLSPRHSKSSTTSAIVPNNTLHSITTTGTFSKDKTSWTMQVLWQNTTGDINMQISLDGSTFSKTRAVPLQITPKVGSPLTATAEVDSTTGVVMVNLFYISSANNITMSALTCTATSTTCITISNIELPTSPQISPYSGLSAVNVNDAEDWRIYYSNTQNQISQIQGNASGFDTGTAIGGTALNGTAIASVNVNSTTNNINLFFVDELTEELMGMQFTGAAWTSPSLLSTALIESWNPFSGLAASYTSTQDQIHVYYTGTDLGIYEMLGSKASKTTNTTWTPQPGRNHIWAEADYVGADIGAVGWKDQGRFFQVVGGKLVMGSLSNQTWSESFISSS